MLASSLLSKSAIRRYSLQMMPRYLVNITKTKASEEPTIFTPPDNTSNSSTTFNPTYTTTSQQPLTITDNCWNRIRQLNDNTQTPKFLRIVVDAGGCSGFSYHFEFNENDTIEPDDHVYGDDAKIVVDEDSLELIQGSTIDYEISMMKSAFKVSDNPQSESACGCGSSFAVKKFASTPALD